MLFPKKKNNKRTDDFDNNYLIKCVDDGEA